MLQQPLAQRLVTGRGLQNPANEEKSDIAEAHAVSTTIGTGGKTSALEYYEYTSLAEPESWQTQKLKSEKMQFPSFSWVTRKVAEGQQTVPGPIGTTGEGRESRDDVMAGDGKNAEYEVLVRPQVDLSYWKARCGLGT